MHVTRHPKCHQCMLQDQVVVVMVSHSQVHHAAQLVVACTALRSLRLCTALHAPVCFVQGIDAVCSVDSVCVCQSAAVHA
jgi:hypothetical protein